MRRLQRRRRDEFDDIFADDSPRERRARDARPALRRATTGAAPPPRWTRCTWWCPRPSTTPRRSPTSSRTAIPVILNLQGIDADLSKRLIDFSSGLTYALDGGMQRIADKVFLLTPRNVEVSAEERARLIEKGFFNQYVGQLPAPGEARVHRGGEHGHGPGPRARRARAGVRPRRRARRAPGRRDRRRGGRAPTPTWPSRPTWWCWATSRTSWRRWPTRWTAPPTRSPRSWPPPDRPARGRLPRRARLPAGPQHPGRGGARRVRLRPRQPRRRRPRGRAAAACSGRCGTVMELDEPLLEPAMAVMSCGPAFMALVVQSLADAGERHGLDAPDRRPAGGGDHGRHAPPTWTPTTWTPAELRHRVATPGGVTERGLAVLEDRGLPARAAAPPWTWSWSRRDDPAGDHPRRRGRLRRHADPGLHDPDDRLGDPELDPADALQPACCRPSSGS